MWPSQLVGTFKQGKNTLISSGKDLKYHTTGAERPQKTSVLDDWSKNPAAQIKNTLQEADIFVNSQEKSSLEKYSRFYRLEKHLRWKTYIYLISLIQTRLKLAKNI